MEEIKPHPLTDEVIDRLIRYRRTLISPSCFKYYHRNTRLVEKAMADKGFKNCKCWISKSIDWLTHEEEETILIEGDLK